MLPTDKAEDYGIQGCGRGDNEDAVIGRIKAGDTQAYEIIMRRYNQRLYRIARGILMNESDAEDAVQDAYVRAFYNLKRYKSTGNFGAWLSRIVVNEALMRKRKLKTDKFNEYKPGDEVNGMNHAPLVSYRDPIDLAAEDEIVKLVENAIDTLPDDFRVVFVMRSIEQMSVNETAGILDIKASTVKTRHFRARQLIQAELKSQIDSAELRAYEFAGVRCNMIVRNVYNTLGYEK